jgi:hypothetical protein
VRPVILDLCGGTGAWSRPYAEAGYDVELVDLPRDVRLERFAGRRIHGILAAPPCTMFCRMRMCRGTPTDAQFQEALSVVDACLRAVVVCRPKWWALENPQGYLSRWLGRPRLKFDPSDYGDPWTKNTWLWGDFVPPMFRKVRAIGPWMLRKKNRPGVNPDNSLNSVTAPGFARAFFDANP